MSLGSRLIWGGLTRRPLPVRLGIGGVTAGFSATAGWRTLPLFSGGHAALRCAAACSHPKPELRPVNSLPPPALRGWLCRQREASSRILWCLAGPAVAGPTRPPRPAIALSGCALQNPLDAVLARDHAPARVELRHDGAVIIVALPVTDWRSGRRLPEVAAQALPAVESIHANLPTSLLGPQRPLVCGSTRSNRQSRTILLAAGQPILSAV